MATFKTDVVTAAENAAAGLGGTRYAAGIIGFAQAKVTVPTTVAASDIIEILENLPEGATLIPSLSSVAVSADPVTGGGGEALTIHVGDAADPDRYAASIDLNAGGIKPFTLGAASVTPYKALANVPLIATVATEGGTNVEVTLTFNIAYSFIG